MTSVTPKSPDDVENDGRWLSQHTRYLMQTKSREPDVILIGDSVIKLMQYSTSYKKFIEPLHSLNFGICDDNFQNILWRVENGELDGVSPKVIIVHVGTDCVGFNAEEIVDGIATVVEQIQQKQHNSTIILLGMMPCGRDSNPRRTKHQKINELLSDIYSNAKTSHQLVLLLPEWENGMLQSDGTISHRDFYDYLHPTDQGYTKIIESLLLDELQISLPSAFLKVDPSDVSVGASGESS